jgi:hypothetical protein
MKPKKISLLEEAMEALRKRFIENPVNRTILMHLDDRNRTGKIEDIMQSVVSEYSIPPYDSPKLFLSEIFEKSLAKLERDGMIEKSLVGYVITPTGANIVRLFEKIEAYQIFLQELEIEKKIQEEASADCGNA